MKWQNVLSQCIFVAAVVFGLLTLASCRVATETPAMITVTREPVAGTPSPRASALGTAAPLPIPTAMPATRTRSPAISIDTTALISTPVPTLTIPHLVEYALARLEDNGRCDLPCWWGITPGETRLQAAKDSFGRAFSAGVSRGDGTVNHSARFGIPSAKPEEYTFTLGFIERGGTIQVIEVRSDVDEAVPSNRFSTDWQRFSLDQVLSHYGQPTHVELQVKPPLHPNSPPSYLMWIVYENHGFWILYAGRSTYDGKIMHICPSLKTTFGLDLRLQSSKSSTPVFQPEPGAGTRSLEEATGMSLEKFYNTFKNAKEKACLDSASTLPQEP
jgi:hypothetical protein